ncbi:hypothetical protein ACQP1O_43080 (plasmid) [Nocardia sp. CA-151230]|uniref:hypothetical protein n=1 Tax=Nocardia sp. CA-151230 TaxID=3239982 RepID=UPI003D89C159
MGNPDLQHRCRQGRRCAARTRTPANEWLAAGVERPDSLCRPCEERAFDAIRELGDDYQMLEVARTEIHSKVSAPKVSGSSELPVPISLAADTLLSDIDTEALRWAFQLTRGEPIPDSGALTLVCTRLGTLVDLPPQLVTVWSPHPDGGDDTTTASLDGVDAVLRLADLHRRAGLVLGITPQRVNFLREPCHVCGLAMLEASVKTDMVKCHSCRNVWSQDQFARLNNPLVAA